MAVLMLDVLLIPYFLPIPIPLSALLFPFWFLHSGFDVPRKIMLPSLVGALSVAVSYTSGQYIYVNDPDLYLVRIVNSGILVFMFMTYPLARHAMIGRQAFAENILLTYFVFSFALAVLFFFDTNLYFQIREFWTFNQDDVYYSSLTVLVRYTGVLSDPNNMAASTSAIAAIIIFRSPAKILRNSAILAATAVMMVASMSVTGFICFAILTASFIFVSRFTDDLAYNSLMRSVAAIMIGVGGVGMYLLIRDDMIFQLAMERVDASDLDSRLSRWQIVFDYDKIVSSIWLGDGGSIFWAGRDYRPHNGHLHIMFSFGIFAYLVFGYIFFRYYPRLGIGNGIFLLLMILIFTVNVGVYEHRFSGIWVILMAYYAESERLRKNDHSARCALAGPSHRQRSPRLSAAR